jgi:integrase
LGRGRLRLKEWKDVHVGAARHAEARHVDLLPILRDTLSEYVARTGERPDDAPLFPSAVGTRQDRNRVRTRIMRPAIAEANKVLAERGLQPLPEGLTPRSLRNTFVSLLFALGHELPYVMEQAGHEDESTTLRIYAKVMQGGDDRQRLREQLRRLVEGADLAVPGSRAESKDLAAV